MSLDAALFSTGAADATRPAGLLNGISALTASALTPASEAAAADVRALVAAVAGVAGNGDVMIIASPGQAASLKLRIAGQLDYPVLASSALAPGTLIAVAVAAVASAVDPTPRFHTSKEAMLHMEERPQWQSAPPARRTRSRLRRVYSRPTPSG